MFTFLFSTIPLVFGLDDMVVAGLIIAVVDAIATVGTSIYNNNKTDERTAQNQQWQEDMMDKENEYNAPENKIARAESAGINPATMFMSGGTNFSSPSAGVSGVGTLASTLQAPQLSNNLLSLANAFKSKQEGDDVKSTRQARIDNILAENEQLRQNASLLGAKATEQEIINQYANAREMFAREGERANIDLTYRQQAIAQRSIQRMDYELTNILPEQFKILVNEGKLQVLDMDKVVAEIADLYSSANLKDTQSGESAVRTVEIGVETGIKQQESDYYSKIQDKYLEKYSAEIRKLSADAGLSEEQAYWIVFDKLGSTFKGARDVPSGLGSGRVLGEQRSFIRKTMKERGYR